MKHRHLFHLVSSLRRMNSTTNSQKKMRLKKCASKQFIKFHSISSLNPPANQSWLYFRSQRGLKLDLIALIWRIKDKLEWNWEFNWIAGHVSIPLPDWLVWLLLIWMKLIHRATKAAFSISSNPINQPIIAEWNSYFLRPNQQRSSSKLSNSSI